MIPGQNLLNMALTVIARQTITYFRATGRTLNNVGQNITQYALPVSVVGSFQPISRQLYEQYGLDFQKDYYTFYTSNDLIDVVRDVSADQIEFNGQRFQCESANDWFVLDGWVGMLCVLIQNDIISDDAIFGFNGIPLLNSNTNFGNGSFVPIPDDAIFGFNGIPLLNSNTNFGNGSFVSDGG